MQLRALQEFVFLAARSVVQRINNLKQVSALSRHARYFIIVLSYARGVSQTEIIAR